MLAQGGRLYDCRDECSPACLTALNSLNPGSEGQGCYVTEATTIQMGGGGTLYDWMEDQCP